jgi:hypothetical protein
MRRFLFAATMPMTPTSISLSVVGERRGERDSYPYRRPRASPRAAQSVGLDNQTSVWGAVPGIAKVLMPDLQVAIPVSWLYDYLHMRKGSPLSRLQREMLATVVNGLIGGAP